MSAQIVAIAVAVAALLGCESEAQVRARQEAVAREPITGRIVPSYEDPVRHVVCYELGLRTTSRLSCVYIPPSVSP